MKKPTEYKGLAGKVVERVLFLERENRGEACVEIQFKDGISLYLDIFPSVTLAPFLVRWKAGNGRIIRRYPARTSAA